MRGETFTLLLVTWPYLQALFIVESEQDSYTGELHDKITMGCRFSNIPSVSHISVTWQRIEPQPTETVYQLDKGTERHNLTSKQFQSRVRLLKKELEKFRAVIELSRVRLNDSGKYQCIVIQDKDGDYKRTELTVRAQYKPIKKTIRRLSEKDVELSCESQGFPLARVAWSDGKLRLAHLTNQSKSSHETNSDGVFVLTSKLSVTNDVNNYTCSYVTDDSTAIQTATFNIPDEIPETKWTTGYAAVGVIGAMCVGLAFALVIVRRRKKGERSADISTSECESPTQNTVTSTDQKSSMSVRSPSSQS